MSTIVLPLLVILIALGGIIAIIARRMSASGAQRPLSGSVRRSVRTTSGTVRSFGMSALRFPKAAVYMLRKAASAVKHVGLSAADRFRRKHERTEHPPETQSVNTADNQDDIHLGPIRNTLHAPGASRIRDLLMHIPSVAREWKDGLRSFFRRIPGMVMSLGPVHAIRERRRKRREAKLHTPPEITAPPATLTTPPPSVASPVPVDKPTSKSTKRPKVQKKPKKKRTERTEQSKKEDPVAHPVPVVAEKQDTELKQQPRRLAGRILRRKLPAEEERDRIPALIEQGNTTEAESLLIDVLSKNPRDIDAYRLLGTVYMQNEDFGQAIEVFEEAIRRDPEHIGIHGSLADCYVVKGEYSKALSAYQRAHEQDDQNVEYLEGLLYIASRMDRTPLVESIAAKILALEPKHEDAKKALSRIRVRG